MASVFLIYVESGGEENMMGVRSTLKTAVDEIEEVENGMGIEIDDVRIEEHAVDGGLLFTYKIETGAVVKYGPNGKKVKR